MFCTVFHSGDIPEEDSTYLTVTKTDDKDYVYAKATKSSVSPVSLRLSCTPGTLPQITWNTDGSTRMCRSTCMAGISVKE